MGRVITDAGGTETMCSNTIGQRDPQTGSIMFLHRSLAKYKASRAHHRSIRTFNVADTIVSNARHGRQLTLLQSPHAFETNEVAWTHMSRQGGKSSWHRMYAAELEAPHHSAWFLHAHVQGICHRPAPDAVVVPITAQASHGHRIACVLMLRADVAC